MAIEKNIKINVDSKQANKNLEELGDTVVGVGKDAEETNEDLKQIGATSRASTPAVKGLGKSFNFLAGALKGLGIGIVIALVAKLAEIFGKNQKVLDFFSTSMETLSIIFSDLFETIFKGTEIAGKFMKDIFENPLENIKAFGKAVKENIIERFESMLEVSGYLAKALSQLFEGDFLGAMNSVNEAGLEMVDVFTGVDDSVNKITVGIVNAVYAGEQYLKQTIKQASANVQLANSAQLAEAQQARLVEQYDRLAETQRQIRDNESKPIKERQEANDELLRVLEKQEEAMLKQAKLQVAYAQSQLDVNNNIENQVALTQALANEEGVLAQITGFKSEQDVNRIALMKEEIELNNSISDAERDRRIAQLEFQESQEEKDLQRLDKERQRLEEENQIILDDLERKRGLYKEGTQARVDAEQEFLDKKQVIDNAVAVNSKATAEAEVQYRKDVKDASLQLASSTLGALGALAKEGSAVAKGVAVAQAIMNTYQGVTKALAETTDPTPTQSLRFGNAIAVGVAGLANVAKILSTKPVESTAPSLAGGGSRPSAPSFNLVQGSATNQIAQSVQTGTRPTRAFVVSSDVTSQQSLDRRIEQGSTL
jgi:hypothetical protein